MLFHILTAILLRPSVIGLLVVLALAAVAVFYFMGPKALLKWALDARVWLAIAGFAAILAVTDLQKENKALKEDVARQELVLEGKKDAQATIEVRRKAREVRAHESTSIRDATAQAAQSNPAEVIDATLDAIAQVQDGGLDGRKHAVSQSKPDGVRDKAPDGDVAP